MFDNIKNNPGPCPLCNTKRRRILFPTDTDRSEFFIVQCTRCGLAQTSPLPTDQDLSIHNFTEYYGKTANKFVPVMQKIRDRLMNIRASYYLSLLRGTGHMPRVLDIGCAEGRLLKSLMENGCQCWGVEHKNYPESRFLCSDRISYLKGGLEGAELQEKSFDLIFMWHVLEHLDNPHDIIGRAYNLLAENGLLVIAVPNFSSTEAGLFKQSWFHLDIPWHKYHFTEKAMKYLAAKNNFVIKKSTTFCIEQNVFGIIQSILNSMKWPRNELYEAIKGNFKIHRAFPLFVQGIIGVSMFIPCLLISFFESKKKNGSVLKIIFKKGS